MYLHRYTSFSLNENDVRKLTTSSITAQNRIFFLIDTKKDSVRKNLREFQVRRKRRAFRFSVGRQLALLREFFK